VCASRGSAPQLSLKKNVWAIPYRQYDDKNIRGSRYLWRLWNSSRVCDANRCGPDDARGKLSPTVHYCVVRLHRLWRRSGMKKNTSSNIKLVRTNIRENLIVASYVQQCVSRS